MQAIFEAIGTRWQLDINEEIDEEQAGSLLAQIRNRIDVFDKNYSRFRDDSLVTAISKGAGRYRLPPDAEKMMSIYKEFYDISAGKMTPLIGRLISDAGYDKNYSFKEGGELRSPPSWNEAIEYSH